MNANLRQLFHRARAYFRRAPLDCDLDENLQNGLSPQEARRRALIRFGGLQQTKESVRDERSLPFLETLLQDLHFGLRMLRKYPGFTRMQCNPGVTSAALVNTLPLGGRVAKRALEIENLVVAPGENPPLFWMDVITPNYFSVMNIPMVAGRAFTPGDATGSAPVVILSASTARHFWPGQNAIGSHLRFSSEQEWRTIIGIVPDVRAYDLQYSIPAWINGTLYLPFNEKATLEGERVPADMTFIIQAGLEESQVQDTLRRTISSMGAEIPITEAKPMSGVVSESVSTSASTTVLFVAFAFLALILGPIGIYGVHSFLVSMRTREFGIRLSLGATPQDLLWLVLREGAQFSMIGMAIGLVSAVAITRLLVSELYGVSPADPLTFLAAASVMTLVTLLACYIPTRRAMRVDPVIALRYE